MVMFLVMGFVIVVALAVIGGLFYFMRKEMEKGGEGQAVLITDISELKQQPAADQKKSDETAESSDDELADAKAKLAALERGKEVVKEESLDVPQEPAARDESTEIKFTKIIGADDAPAALSSADDSRLKERVYELELQLKTVSDKAVHQAEEAVKVIEALMKENEDLKARQIVSPAAGGSLSEEASKSILELKEKNSILENQLDLSSSKITQLETQLTIIKKEMGQQLIEANATIARLKVETEAQDRIGQESLFKEKREMDEWKEKTSRQLRDMEDSLMQTKEESLLLKDAKKLLEAKVAVLEDDHKKELGQAKEIINGLAAQKEAQTQHTAELEQNIEKLKELNSTLIDKAKILQYELNRHRAQASGLERVCSNFKEQMESLFGQVEETKKINNRLLAERTDLETGVASLRSENFKLAERDREYQQELLKTKEQISRFEKIYSNFKTDISNPKSKEN